MDPVNSTAEGGPKKRSRKRTRKSRTKGADDDEGVIGAESVDVASNNESVTLAGASTRPAQDVSSATLKAKEPYSDGSAKSYPQPQEQAVASSSVAASNPHKPSVLPRPSIYGPRKYTLSVALPSSIVYNAQTMELKTRLVGSLARICAVFNVDEIVVFDDGTPAPQQQQQQAHEQDGRGRKRDWNEQDNGEGNARHRNGGGNSGGNSNEPFDANSFMAMVLQYLETPQYMRRTLFPMHPHLRLAGLLPPLDCPHHLRFEDESPFRDGLVVDAPHWAGQQQQQYRATTTTTAWVNVGHRDPLQCKVRGAQVPPVGTRVTVEMPLGGRGNGTLVSPRTPVQAQGLYWGYSVRLVPSLSEVFTNLPFAASSGEATTAQEEYDLVIGTAERGDALTDVLAATNQGSSVTPSKAGSSDDVKPLPSNFQHALILFGGLSGLEVAIEADAGIPLGLDDARELCDFWVDVAEGQGSRTVRTEEALTITLARLKTTLEQLGRR